MVVLNNLVKLSLHFANYQDYPQINEYFPNQLLFPQIKELIMIYEEENNTLTNLELLLASRLVSNHSTTLSSFCLILDNKYHTFISGLEFFLECLDTAAASKLTQLKLVLQSISLVD